jgi:hypothetical protein
MKNALLALFDQFFLLQHREKAPASIAAAFI